MKKSGNLYVIATPIGNLEDITYRAIRILNEVNWIGAEDTRITKKLLSYYNISTKIFSLHSYNEKERLNFIIERLSIGESVAIVSDAGIPTLSDPGEKVVKMVLEKGFRVIPIPGPSAITTTFMVTGLPWKGTIILGFLPRKKKKRIMELEKLNFFGSPAIIFEHPKRLINLVNELIEILPEREVVICRELTKLHEEVLRGTPNTILNLLKDKEIKGEVTIFVGPGEPKKREKESNLKKLIEECIKVINNPQLSTKKKAEKLKSLLNINSKEAYKLVVKSIS